MPNVEGYDTRGTEADRDRPSPSTSAELHRRSATASRFAYAMHADHQASLPIKRSLSNRRENVILTAFLIMTKRWLTDAMPALIEHRCSVDSPPACRFAASNAGEVLIFVPMVIDEQDISKLGVKRDFTTAFIDMACWCPSRLNCSGLTDQLTSGSLISARANV